MANITVPTRSDRVTNGRYLQGGVTTVNGNRLGWWERKIFAKSLMDIPFTLIRKYDRRPDILALDMYGKSNLMWFILQYNNISDVNVEFVAGAVIMLPTKGRLTTELLTKTQPL